MTQETARPLFPAQQPQQPDPTHLGMARVLSLAIDREVARNVDIATLQQHIAMQDAQIAALKAQVDGASQPKSEAQAPQPDTETEANRVIYERLRGVRPDHPGAGQATLDAAVGSLNRP